MNTENLKDLEGKIIEGPLVIKPNLYYDYRGYFYENWNLKVFQQNIKDSLNFVQDNSSFSHKGVIRGLHFQISPLEQGKLVRVSAGSIFDVIVDLRIKSKTFSKWAGIKLSKENNKQLWIPNGFAHGFMSLKEETIVDYKVTNYWSKDHERSLLWSDKDINIKWPKGFDIKISKKDSSALTLKNLISNNELL